MGLPPNLPFKNARIFNKFMVIILLKLNYSLQSMSASPKYCSAMTPHLIVFLLKIYSVLKKALMR